MHKIKCKVLKIFRYGKYLVAYVLKPASKIVLLTVPRRYFFCGSLCYFCLVFVMLSRLFIACRERADLLTLVCDV